MLRMLFIPLISVSSRGAVFPSVCTGDAHAHHVHRHIHPQGQTCGWALTVLGHFRSMFLVSHLPVTFHKLLLWRQNIFFKEALVDNIPCWEVPGHHKGGTIACRCLPHSHLLCVLPHHGCEVSSPRGEARLLEVVVLDFTVPSISHLLSCLIVGCPCEVLPALATTGLRAVLEDPRAGQGFRVLLGLLVQLLAELQWGDAMLLSVLIVGLQDLIIELFGSWNDNNRENGSVQRKEPHQKSKAYFRATPSSVLWSQGQTAVPSNTENPS